MAERAGMVCPTCNQAMNHHADKIDYTAALDRPDAADATWDGVLLEFFTCPHCGHSASRLAD
jgi:hypothetical protein